jgi:hypothetical protein
MHDGEATGDADKAAGCGEVAEVYSSRRMRDLAWNHEVRCQITLTALARLCSISGCHNFDVGV